MLRSAVAALEGLPDEPVGELRIAGTPVALPRGSVFSPTRETHGRIDAMALYAGEGVGQIRDVPPAREIVAALIRDAEALLARPR